MTNQHDENISRGQEKTKRLRIKLTFTSAALAAALQPQIIEYLQGLVVSAFTFSASDVPPQGIATIEIEDLDDEAAT